METFDCTLTIDGVEIFFEERGDPAAEPLILLHGFTGSGADWRLVFDLDALAREYRVLIPDARGHGRSTNPTGEFSVRRCALDVLGLLDTLGVESFRAVGLSLGAKTLLHVATRAPARVRAMVLVSATPYFPEQARSLMRAAGAAEHSEAEWALMRSQHRHGDDQIRALWRTAATFAASYDDMNFTPPYLSTITAQTLLVNGDRDPLYPVELSVEMYRAIPRSRLWIVPDEGHVPIFGEARDAFVKTALTFLRKQG